MDFKKFYVNLLCLIVLVLNSCTYTQKKSIMLYKEAAEQGYDIIIVPGLPFEDGEWSQIMRGRIMWAKILLEKGITKNVMFSGSAVYTPYTESKIMALYAQEVGVPSDNIYLETEAEHSVENAYYSYKKAKELGFEKIALASDPFQTKMLKSFIKKRLGDDVGIIPFVFDTLATTHPPKYENVTIDYQSVFIEDHVPITEKEGFWQRFRGTRGKNIDFDENQ